MCVRVRVCGVCMHVRVHLSIYRLPRGQGEGRPPSPPGKEGKACQRCVGDAVVFAQKSLVRDKAWKETAKRLELKHRLASY